MRPNFRNDPTEKGSVRELLRRLSAYSDKLRAPTIAALILAGAIVAILYAFAVAFGSAAFAAMLMNKIFPVLYIANIIVCLVGIIYTYLTGAHGFRFNVSSDEQPK